MKTTFIFGMLGGCGSDPLDGLAIVGRDRSDAPVSGLDADWQRRFDDGDVLFDEVFRDSTGLGPAYIRHSCASCHDGDARGPGVVEKFVRVDAEGRPDADQSVLPWGHTARPHVAGGGVTPIVAPDRLDVLVTVRSPNAVFGRGYLEAVDPAAIEALERQQAGRSDGISGRINRVAWQSQSSTDHRFSSWGPGDDALIGRFGLKGRIASIEDFVADAYQGDMSITSPLRPLELPNPDGLTDDALPGADVDAETVSLVADYVRLLAIPDRREVDGAALFDAVGCADCHVRTMPTRPDWPIAPLAGIDAEIYTDLLVHEMGISDGIADGGALPSEWRTAPLIGLRHLRGYLHDGAAATVGDAIARHASPGSEANAVIAAFDALSAPDRATLLTYVESL